MAERENMKSGRWIVVVQALILSAGPLVVAAEPDAKIMKYFTVQWSSVQYDKSVEVQNPAVVKGRSNKSETLTLSCQVEIGDPNMVLGTCREPVITEVTDSKGRQLDLGVAAPQSRQTYSGLRYKTRFQRPAQPSRWQTVVRRLLMRPVQPLGPPQLVTELEPSQIAVRLDNVVLAQAGGELQSVKGYFYALVAGSLDRVEVPFEPNSAWVRLTPDLEIRVTEAVSTDDSFHYRIDVPPQGRASRSLSLTVGEPLPNRLVIAQQFITEDGKLSRAFSGGRMSLPAHIGGSGNAGGTGGRIKTIRYIIAVDPTEYRIPFELKNVPLPDPNQ